MRIRFFTTRLKSTLWLGCGSALLLAACQSAPVTVLATPTVMSATASLPPATSTPAPSPTEPAATATEAATAPATAAASASPTLAPSATVAASPSATPSTSPTAAPTVTARPTAGQPTAAPTRPPFQTTPLGPPQPAPLYSTTTGPDGYASRIQCQRPNAPCAPIMPPGDISFQLGLSSDAAAPWTHFINYGLAVERNGANVAGLFMFVDAGWLQPGAVVGFGASRNFDQPGTYVIRSSGCLTTDPKSTGCGWATIAGDVVTFTIR